MRCRRAERSRRRGGRGIGPAAGLMHGNAGTAFVRQSAMRTRTATLGAEARGGHAVRRTPCTARAERPEPAACRIVQLGKSADYSGNGSVGGSRSRHHRPPGSTGTPARRCSRSGRPPGRTAPARRRSQPPRRARRGVNHTVRSGDARGVTRLFTGFSSAHYGVSNRRHEIARWPGRASRPASSRTPRPASVAISNTRSRQDADVVARVLVEGRRQVHEPQHVEVVGAVAAVAAERDADAGGDHLGEPPVGRQPLGVLEPGGRAVHDLHAAPGEQRDVGVVDVDHVRELGGRAQHAERVEAGQRDRVAARPRGWQRGLSSPNDACRRPSRGALDQCLRSCAEPSSSGQAPIPVGAAVHPF